ncbi:unnamed protein product [Chrysoparadoxa australica]
MDALRADLMYEDEVPDVSVVQGCIIYSFASPPGQRRMGSQSHPRMASAYIASANKAAKARVEATSKSTGCGGNYIQEGEQGQGEQQVLAGQPSGSSSAWKIPPLQGVGTDEVEAVMEIIQDGPTKPREEQQVDAVTQLLLRLKMQVMVDIFSQALCDDPSRPHGPELVEEIHRLLQRAVMYTGGELLLEEMRHIADKLINRAPRWMIMTFDMILPPDYSMEQVLANRVCPNRTQAQPQLELLSQPRPQSVQTQAQKFSDLLGAPFNSQFLGAPVPGNFRGPALVPKDGAARPLSPNTVTAGARPLSPNTVTPAAQPLSPNTVTAAATTAATRDGSTTATANDEAKAEADDYEPCARARPLRPRARKELPALALAPHHGVTAEDLERSPSIFSKLKERLPAPVYQELLTMLLESVKWPQAGREPLPGGSAGSTFANLSARLGKILGAEHTGLLSELMATMPFECANASKVLDREAMAVLLTNMCRSEASQEASDAAVAGNAGSYSVNEVAVPGPAGACGGGEPAQAMNPESHPQHQWQQQQHQQPVNAWMGLNAPHGQSYKRQMPMPGSNHDRRMPVPGPDHQSQPMPYDRERMGSQQSMLQPLLSNMHPPLHPLHHQELLNWDMRRGGYPYGPTPTYRGPAPMYHQDPRSGYGPSLHESRMSDGTAGGRGGDHWQPYPSFSYPSQQGHHQLPLATSSTGEIAPAQAQGPGRGRKKKQPKQRG